MQACCILTLTTTKLLPQDSIPVCSVGDICRGYSSLLVRTVVTRIHVHVQLVSLNFAFELSSVSQDVIHNFTNFNIKN